jgi:hypothetical protein
MTNLPSFDGANVVYERAQVVCSHLNAARYTKQAKIANGRKFKFIPDDDATAIIEAMNRGDEETLKAFNHQFRHLWQ